MTIITLLFCQSFSIFVPCKFEIEEHGRRVPTFLYAFYEPHQ